MMRYLVAFILSFIAFTASAQTTQILGAPGTKVVNRGDFQVDSILYIPRTLVSSRTPTQSGALRYQASDSSLYQWTGTQWVKVTGGIFSVAGQTNYLPKYTSSSTLGNSAMYDSSGYLKVYSNNIGNVQNFDFQNLVGKLNIVKDGLLNYGLVLQQNDSLTNSLQLVANMRKGLLTNDTVRNGHGVGIDFGLQSNTKRWRRSGWIASRVVDSAEATFKADMVFMVNSGGNFIYPLIVRPDSTIRVLGLAGSGTRNVVADANGDLRVGSGSEGLDTLLLSTRAWRQKGDDSVAAIANAKVGGSGTTNRVAKFTASGTVGNGSIADSSSSVQMTILSGGNIGIGTAAPAQKLSIFGGASTTFGISLIPDGWLTARHRWTVPSSGNESVLSWNYNGSVVDNSLFATSAIHLGNGTLSLRTGADNTAPSNRMQLHSTGNITIGGATDAGYRLDVQGNLRNTTGANFATTSGNVGIGTESPQRRLELSVAPPATSDDGIRISDTSKIIQIGRTGFTFSYRGVAPESGYIYSNDNIQYLSDGGYQSWHTSGGERMRITSTGNVGIGTTNPLMGLHIAKSLGNDVYGGLDGNANQLIIRSNLYFDLTNSRPQPIKNGFQQSITMDNNAGTILFNTSSSSNNVGDASTLAERMRIFANGRVGINTNSDAGFQLDVNGNIRTTTGANFATSSGGVRIGDATAANRKLEVVGGNARISNTTAENDVIYEILGLNAGTDATLGPLLMGIKLVPSATASSRRAIIDVGDNTGFRNLTFSVNNVGISTNTPAYKLDVSGTGRFTDSVAIQNRLRVTSIDSSASPINMLWADVNGVIKKTAVPTAAVDSVKMRTATITAGSGFTLAKEAATGTSINQVVGFVDASGLTTVKLNGAVYKTTATFTTGSWVTIATIAEYRPNNDVYFSLPNLVSGESFESTGNVDFTAAAAYSGATSLRVKVNGDIQAYVGAVDASADLSGANYVILPIVVSYPILTLTN